MKRPYRSVVTQHLFARIVPTVGDVSRGVGIGVGAVRDDHRNGVGRVCYMQNRRESPEERIGRSCQREELLPAADAGNENRSPRCRSARAMLIVRGDMPDRGLRVRQEL